MATTVCAGVGLGRGIGIRRGDIGWKVEVLGLPREGLREATRLAKGMVERGVCG